MKLAHAALVVPALLLVAACGASDPAMSADSAAPPDAGSLSEPGAAPAAPPEDGVARDGADLLGGTGGSAGYVDAKSPSSVTPQTRAVISKGQVSLESDDLDRARFDLQKLLDTWNGSITNEESSADDEGRTDRQRLEIRVPAKDFGTAMDAISGLGKLVDRSRTSEDVTTQVIDVNARVRSQKLSLARVQALLAKAKDLNQIIAIESQLSQRQAELDSLEQQQKYLADQTAESTINVYLSLTDTDAATDDEDDASGFVAGLKDGWNAFRDATTGLLQGLGAVLPFAVVLAAIGVPVALAWRRRRSLT